MPFHATPQGEAARRQPPQQTPATILHRIWTVGCPTFGTDQCWYCNRPLQEQPHEPECLWLKVERLYPPRRLRP
jgi:hypothetical protein